jgi:hypothetical protein
VTLETAAAKDADMGNEFPQIESVSACAVRVPLEVPTSFSTRRVLAREYALVRVRGTDGITGIL